MFLGKTLISLANAPAITLERVAAGDSVLSYKDSAVTPAVVVRALHEDVDKFVMVHHGASTTYTLPEQAFFVDGRGWLTAQELRRGDKLINLAGHWDQVGLVSEIFRGESLYKRIVGFAERSVCLSTLVLEDATSFFANGVLVHG